MAVPYQHARGTRANFTTLASGGGLHTGQVYYITDEQRLVVATSTTASVNMAKQSETSGAPAWGAITGTLSSQTDLQSALNAKAPLASPTFTGQLVVNADGSATAPAISVGAGVTDTGFYYASGQLAITQGGTLKAYFNNTAQFVLQACGLTINSFQPTTINGTVDISGITTFTADLNAINLKLIDTDASHRMSIVVGSNLTANRVLTVTTGDSDRTLTLTGNASITGTNTGDQSSIVGITGTLAQFNTAVTDADLAPISNPQFTGTAFFAQPTPTTVSTNGAKTLTIAEMLTLIFISTGTVAKTWTLPTGTLTDAGLVSGTLAVGQGFEWYIINTGTSAAAITMAAGTNHSYTGATAVAIGTSARFFTVKLATNSYATYRIG